MAPKGRSRGFEELKVHVNSPQPASERFPKSEESSPPAVAHFRNNMTALSQYYNLFFVASLDRVLVYEPLNQEQYLSTPRSTIHLASSNSGLIGFIDPDNSHAINQLIVADLGIEELIVAVCDDGDVVAYTTRSIKKEIEYRAPDPYDSPDFVSELRPFFVNNVGKSAWGVAVSKAARMIAVSSNSKKINVFVFALSDSSCDTPDEEYEDNLYPDFTSSFTDQEWVQPTLSDALVPDDRSRNLEIILSAHWTNIPNISFFNPATPSVEDVFLVSTDIEGTTYIWNIWQRAVIKEINLPMDNVRGWGVACIDPYFCRKAESSTELFGIEGVNTSASLINITHAATSVPESSEDHFTLRNRAIQLPTTEHIQDEAASDEDEDMENEYDEEFDAIDDLGLDEHLVDDDGEMENDAPTEADEDWESDTQSVMEGVENADHSLQTIPSNSVDASNQESYLEEPTQEAAMVFSHLPEPVRSALRNRLNFPRPNVLSPLNKAQSSILPFYVLQTTKSDIHLLHSIQPQISCLSSHNSSKEVVCRAPLHQHLRLEDICLSRLERLNMILQVPELSLVVVGDQAGRVALLTITRCRAKDKKNKDDKVGFRFERFLPLMSQEDNNQRPKFELLGVAVGPISSRLLKRADALSDDDASYSYIRRREAWREFEGSRRYRLILYYCDHTILSYEIGRPVKRVSDMLII
ncbi:MAG: hypothetical protein Q9225_001388 [Loekoesia sp. 1 TL-2023]